MTTNAREGPPVPDDVHQCREVRLSYGPRRKCGPISDSRTAAHFGRRIIDPSADREHFAAAYLDARNVPVGWRVVSIGTLTQSLVHPREVFRPALILGAAAVVAFHNHPTGDPSPSPKDLALTERLVNAGVLLGVPLLDHVILGCRRHVAIRESHPHFFAAVRPL